MPKQTVIYPFSVEQQVRVKRTGIVRRITEMRILEHAGIQILCPDAGAIHWHAPEDLEDVPATPIERLKDLKAGISHYVALDQNRTTSVVAKLDAIIAELEERLE